MYSLVYVSQATQSFDELSIRNLANQAYLRNSQLSITGFLSYYDDQFLQYIEGEKKALDELMGFITTDVRHTILEVMHLPFSHERRFASWHMRYLPSQRMVTVNLEKVLTDVLIKMNKSLYGKECAVRSVQSILEKFSSYFATFPHPPAPSLQQLIDAGNTATPQPSYISSTPPLFF